jgi:Holliday junction resolvase RusA-like endonuclease
MPVCSGNCKPRLIMTKEGKANKEYIQMECLRQGARMLSGNVSLKVDILIKGNKDYDIDGIFKLLQDSMEGICYKNDKNIKNLVVRKHNNQDEDKFIILVEDY